jgi:putative DNA primase/helicase
MSEEKTFEFTMQTQKKIFAMVLFDEKFLESNNGRIKPSYFDSLILRDMTRIVIGFYEKYLKIPTELEFLEEVDTFITERKKREKDFPYQEYLDTAKEILEIGKEGNFDYVRDKAVEFARHQAVKQALRDAGEKKLKRCDYEGIVASIQDAVGIGDGRETGNLKEICLEEVKPESVSWLWQDRIPEGKLTLFVGDPGVGKSFLMASFIKHVTTGEGRPDYPRGTVKKGSVILLNAEDGLADTIVQRLHWAGADRSKVTFIEATIEKNGEERLFRLDKDVPKLEKSIKAKKDVRLIVIDPLSAYMGNIDTHRTSDTRGVLTPLARLAERYKVAIVVVLHLNKKTDVQAIYRVSGSIAFTAAARVIWYVAEDGENEEQRLLSVLKNNISPKPKREMGMAFQLKEGKVLFDEVPMLKTPQEILRDQESVKRKSVRDAAAEFLKEVLKKGPRPQSEIKELAKDEHFSWRTVEYAKDELGIEAEKEKIKKGKWFWKLPDKEPKEENLKERVEEIKAKHKIKPKSPEEEERLEKETREALARIRAKPKADEKEKAEKANAEGNE